VIFEHLPVWAAVLVVVVTYLCLGVGIFGGFMALSIQREERRRVEKPRRPETARGRGSDAAAQERQAAKDLGYIPGRQGAAR